MVFLASILWEKKEKDEEYVFLIFVIRNAISTDYSLYSVQFFAVSRAERFILANATTKNLGEYSESALKISFSQRALIFHINP